MTTMTVSLGKDENSGFLTSSHVISIIDNVISVIIIAIRDSR